MALFLVIIVFVLIAVALSWFFLSQDKGEKEPVLALWIALGFGLLGGIAAGLIEYLIIPTKALQGSNNPLTYVLIASLGVGIIEEACKFIPLSLFIYGKKYFNEHTDGIIYFALVGLGFGIPENILYTISFGTHVGIVRIVLTPLFHAATTGMVGYFLIKSKIDHQPMYKPILALLFAMLLHGLYDFGLVSGSLLFVVLSLMITVGITASLFILFMRAQELDRQQGLSRVGVNNFCRSCGTANPNNNLHCSHCGKLA
jgi:RsiW-degrading membrane proteinase PrsW (M82 family)